MIGDSTYIPLVKKKIMEDLGIKVNQSVDPTNAVAIGAAFYAGNKTKKVENASNFGQNTEGVSSNEKPTVTLKTAYQKAMQDRDEIFMADVSGATAGMTYRLTRQDGGFDSGRRTDERNGFGVEKFQMPRFQMSKVVVFKIKKSLNFFINLYICIIIFKIIYLAL